MNGRHGRMKTGSRFTRCRNSLVRGSEGGGLRVCKPASRRRLVLRRQQGWTLAAAAVGLLAWTGEAAAQTAPKVTSISVDSGPSNGDTYGLGERIDVLVYFDQAVRVDGGTPPQVALQIGGETRYASYWYYGPYVHFAYIVTAEDKDTDGISIPANALTSNGPSILLATDTSVAADLSHEAVAAGPNHRVDGGIVSVPIVQTVFFQSSSQRGDVYGPGETIRSRRSLRQGCDRVRGTRDRDPGRHGDEGQHDVVPRKTVRQSGHQNHVLLHGPG